MAQFCVLCDGSDDYIRIPNPSFLNGLSVASIAFKFKWTGTPGEATSVKYLFGRDQSIAMRIGLVDHKIEFIAHIGAWQYSYPSLSDLDDGREHSIVAIFNRKRLKIAVDGKIETVREVTEGVLSSPDTDLYLACWAPGAYHCPCFIDDFCLYDYELPDDEIWKYQVGWVR